MNGLRSVRLASQRGRRCLERLRGRGRGVLDPAVEAASRRIVRDVRRRGGPALEEWRSRLDGAGGVELRIDPAAIPAASVPEGLKVALDGAISAVRAFHLRQRVPGYRLRARGFEVEERRQPLARVGIYVPGGRAVYVSSVIMTVVPARVAGVDEIVLATPPRAWAESGALRHVAARLGVREVWSVGGAQAIAALAYGTETLRPVDKIVGPGNAWVAAAKRLVAGDVAVDGIAGPSEVVIFAGPDAPADWLAADLLAQAEHDPRAAAVLVTSSRDLARRVSAAIDRQLPDLATREVAARALADYGIAFLVDDLEAGLAAVETIAPEHLQLVGEGPEGLAGRVRNAGAIFVGAAAGEVFGDYVAGPSHVLPTCGTARFASGLGVEDFVRRSHVVRMTPEAAAERAPTAIALAEAEGLPGHAAAARRRIA